jgi:hypothetical protein
MKRLMTLVLALGFVLGSFGLAQATEITANGTFDFSFGWYDNFDLFDSSQDSKIGGQFYGAGGGEGTEDDFQARQRTRLQVNFIASENVQGVLFFEIGETEWGYTENGNVGGRSGGRFNTDGVNVETRRAYITFNVPNTELLFQVGLQGIALPSAVVGSPIVGSGGTDMAAAVGIYTVNEMVSVAAFWARPYNMDYGYGGSVAQNDEMDLIGLFVPVTVDGIMNVTPYAMYGIFGTDAVADSAGNFPGLYSNALGTNSMARNNALMNNDYFYGWWAGLALEFTMMDPLVFMLDVAWGSLDDPTDDMMDRWGWYLAGEIDYKTPWVTPGILAWWTSGDDGDMYDGSERLPTLDANFAATSFGWDGGDLLNNDDVMGTDASGTWGIALLFKDISFVENLTHQVRLAFYGGTNSPYSMRDRRSQTSPHNPYWNNPSNIMLTTADWAWEVNFDTQYQIYENLAAILETGMVDVQRQAYPWRNPENRRNSGWYNAGVQQLWKTSTAWKLGFGLKYTF